MGFFKSLPRIALPTLRNIKASVREADLVMIRLPSPIGFLVYREAQKQGKLRFLYIAGDIRRVATQGEKYRNPLVRFVVAAAANTFHRLTRRMARGSLVFVTGSELHREFAPIAKRCVNLIPSVISEKDIFVRKDTCLAEPIRLLCVGRLVPVKGLKYLFQALRQLLDRGPKAELLLVGHGYHRPKLEGLAWELGITGQVSFLGRVPFGPELFRLYREADIFVLPSLSEGIPKTLLEAMASGLPIVATRVGGVPDVVKDGKTGLLVAPRSPGELAEAIERIIREGELRRKLIRNGYAFVREHTVERQAKRMWQEIRTYFGIEER
ncbi:MAG TPA: glycosyltransferase [Planctomycetes bacterium]|nr:glycosyltransferase [Planctomycetota bacterium]